MTSTASTSGRRSQCFSCMHWVPSGSEELTRLMVRYDVGVAAKETYQLKSVDDDFFEDGE